MALNVITSFYDFNSMEHVEEGVLYLLYTSRRFYSPNDIVVMTLIKANPGPTDVLFIYPTTQYYDFFVQKDNITIWRWSEDKFFLQVIQEKMLEAGEMYTAQVTWQIPAGTSPGIYELEARNLARPDIRLQVPIVIGLDRSLCCENARHLFND